MVSFLFLCAGYGTRLKKDFSQTSDYKQLMDLPKGLLPVNGRTLLDRWFDDLKHLDNFSLEKVYLVANSVYYPLFVKFANKMGIPSSHVMDDGSSTNSNRRGAMGSLSFALKNMKILDDLIVIGGDTLVTGWSLKSIYHEFHQNSTDFGVLYYQLKDEQSVCEKGILELGSSVGTGRKVTSFLEKPKENETTSRYASPCFYIFSKNTLQCIDEYLEDPSNERDAPGHFVRYMVHGRSNSSVIAWPIQRRFDVGRLADYIHTNTFFQSNETKED